RRAVVDVSGYRSTGQGNAIGGLDHRTGLPAMTDDHENLIAETDHTGGVCHLEHGRNVDEDQVVSGPDLGEERVDNPPPEELGRGDGLSAPGEHVQLQSIVEIDGSDRVRQRDVQLRHVGETGVTDGQVLGKDQARERLLAEVGIDHQNALAFRGQRRTHVPRGHTLSVTYQGRGDCDDQTADEVTDL